MRVEARREESNPNVQSLIRMTIWNEDTAPLNNLSARYFVDLSEVYAAGYAAGNVTLDVYYSSAGVTVSPLTAYDAANRIYYFELNWGSYSLARAAGLRPTSASISTAGNRRGTRRTTGRTRDFPAVTPLLYTSRSTGREH